MTWQVAGDIAVGLAIPLVTAFLYFTGRIQTRHVWMMVWGFAVGSTWEFAVELMGNGVIWEYRVYSWNPVWLTIGEQGYTILPQLIWVVAPIVYYLGFIRINRMGEASA